MVAGSYTWQVYRVVWWINNRRPLDVSYKMRALLTLKQDLNDVSVLHLQVLCSLVVDDTLSIEEQTAVSYYNQSNSPDGRRVLSHTVGICSLV